MKDSKSSSTKVEELDGRLSNLRKQMNSVLAAKQSFVDLQTDQSIRNSDDKELAGFVTAFWETKDDPRDDGLHLLDGYKACLEARLGRKVTETECGEFYETGFACYQAGKAFERAMQRLT